MWMRRRPTARARRGTGYEPAYADGGALRAIAAGLSAEAAAAVAAVAPDILAVAPDIVPAAAPVPRAVTRVPVASYPLLISRPMPHALVRLGFADATTLDLDPAAPWGRALLAIAGDLVAVRRR